MNQVLTRQPPPPTEPAAAARQKPLDESVGLRPDLAAMTGVVIGRSPVDSGHVRFVVTLARSGREVSE
jgi:hypothetical protein